VGVWLGGRREGGREGGLAVKHSGISYPQHSYSLPSSISPLPLFLPPPPPLSIQNLRKVVVRGAYDPLPNVYGTSFAALIGRLLQINPSDRPEAKDILKDPLVERHKYLLLHPLPVGSEEAEGEMLPTIRVASEKGGVKTITLPGPAYEEEGGNEGGVGSPKSPKSPTSVFVVYSPRAKEGGGNSSSSISSSSSSSSSSNNNYGGSAGDGMNVGAHPLKRSAQPRTNPGPTSSPPSSSPPFLPPSLLHPMPRPRSPPSVSIPASPSSTYSSCNTKETSSPSSKQQKQTTPFPPSAAGSPARTSSPLTSLLPALQDLGRDLARHLPSRASLSPKELLRQQQEKEKARLAAANFGGGAIFVDTGDDSHEALPDSSAGAASATGSGGPAEGKSKRSSIRKVFDGESIPAFPTAEMKNFFSGGKLPLLPSKGKNATSPTGAKGEGGEEQRRAKAAGEKKNPGRND